MKCPQCGVENSKKAKFCVECGKKLPDKTDEKFSILEGKNKLLIPIIAIIAILAVTVIYFGYLSSSTATAENATVHITNGVTGTVTVYDPLKKQETDIQIPYEEGIIGYGTGFLVNSDGYIITAQHVIADPWYMVHEGRYVQMESKDVKWMLDKIGLQIYLANNPQLLAAVAKAYNIKTNEDFNNKIDDIVNDFIDKGWLSSNGEQAIHVSGPAFGVTPGSNTQAGDSPVARIVDFGDTTNSIDICLLKLEGLPPLPYYKINPKKLQTGEKVNIYGYPLDQALFYEVNIKEGYKPFVWKGQETPSLTTGIVSAERQTATGITFYQTDASTNHGNSGGPVCDTNNDNVGVLVQGMTNVQGTSGTGVQGFNFFLSSQYVVDLCKKNNVAVTTV